MKLPAYREYNDSSIEWLGDLPADWEIKKLKHLGDAQIGLTYEPSEVVSEEEGTLVLRSSNVQAGKISLGDNIYVQKQIPRKLVTKEGDILICSRNGSRALIGKNAMIDRLSAGVTFGAFMTIFRSEVNRYLYWVFNSLLFEYQSGSFLTSTINQLTVGNLNSFEVPLPPPSDQRAIADFLNTQTAKIDALLAKKRELIDKLKEKRTALISRTVTRGLPPEAARAVGLDPHPPMKASGVDWLGDVPEHWRTLPLKYVASITTGYAFSSDDFVDEGVPVLRIGDISKDGNVDLNNAKYLPDDYVRTYRNVLVLQGDIVMAMTGATIGKAGRYLSCKSALLNQRVCIFRPNNNNHPGYLWYLVNSRYYTEHISLTAFGGAQPNISDKQLLECSVPIPIPDEQRAIADYLDYETARIDRMVTKAEGAIERLQEYRTALITSAVTGKIDVRGAAA